MPRPSANDAHDGWDAALATERARLVRLCRRFTGDADTAEDLAQEALIEAWRHLDRLRDPDRRSQWLAGIARNVCLRWVRQRGRAPALVATPDLVEDVVDDLSTDVAEPTAEVERAELADLLDRALGLLPLDVRDLMVERYQRDTPIADIAARRGTTEGAIAMQLQRGRQALWQALHRNLFADAAAHGLVDLASRPRLVDFVCTRDAFRLAPGRAVRWLDWDADDELARDYWAHQGAELSRQEWLDRRDQLGYRYCAAVIAGRIEALATVWLDAGGAGQIVALSTRDGRSRRGLGKAVLGFVTEHILATGEKATLTLYRDDHAWRTVAESVGYRARRIRIEVTHPGESTPGRSAVPTILGLYVEVAGCPTVCQHCWALGRPYRAMPVEDVAYVLATARRFCAERSWALHAYPMHEVAAHPAAAAVLRLFYEQSVPHPADGGREIFEPLATTGVPLALRDDWREVLDTLRTCGGTMLWLAFHGIDDEHDRQVNRPGAYAESCLAVERAHSAGFRVGCNCFLTRPNLTQLDAWIAELTRLGIDEVFWSVAGYGPTPRFRRYDAIRPELSDLLAAIETVKNAERFPLAKKTPAELVALTEAHWVELALADRWPATPESMQPSISVVCRRNLDVHVGIAGHYGPRLGNLRLDGPDRVLARAVERGPMPFEAHHFGTDAFPPIRDLAARHGDPRGRKLHFWAHSMRNRWLDLALGGASHAKRAMRSTSD